MGGTLIFLYIGRLGLSFFRFKIFEFRFFFFGGAGGGGEGWFRKMNILWGMLLWGHHEIGLYLRVISMHFKLKFLIFFGVNGRCWAQAYV